MIKNFFALSLRDKRAIGIVIVIALAVLFAPQVKPTDWELNTNSLSQGLTIYESHNYVYPPWSLILLWPYRWIGAEGSRILSVLVIAALYWYRNWSIGRFLAIIANPFFIFSMLYSNLDLLVLTFPLFLWEIFRNLRWSFLGWGLALCILLIKPQGAALLILYLFWHQRERWREIALALLIVAIVTLPISFIASPPLLLQWLNNIFNPSDFNLSFWSANNISLTSRMGLIWALPIVITVFGSNYALFRYLGKNWTVNHSYLSLLLISMLLSPYASNQSVIAAFAFAPSAISSLLHHLITYITNRLDIYLYHVPFWIIVFGLIALWFLPTEKVVESKE